MAIITGSTKYIGKALSLHLARESYVRKEEAQAIANAVVGARIASSTNIIGPAESTY